MRLIGKRGESEVGDHRLTSAIQHDVGGFEIAVQYALGMRSR
jgi:hypothetical protein